MNGGPPAPLSSEVLPEKPLTILALNWSAIEKSRVVTPMGAPRTGPGSWASSPFRPRAINIFPRSGHCNIQDAPFFGKLPIRSGNQIIFHACDNRCAHGQTLRSTHRHYANTFALC